MIVLSLFDGMSCGQIAFEDVGIKIDKYYASEIDKYAQIVSRANYPDTIYLGDITKWKEWDIEQPDIIIGGSPCQGFSFAGKRLNFEDERSKLFFVFIEILKHYKPKYFLLENVIMNAMSNDVISRNLGELYPECTGQQELFQEPRLEPIQINSALVSAQNRQRLYWTNIDGIEQPKDRKIYLKDIIENGSTIDNKSFCICANYLKVGKGSDADLRNYFDKSRGKLIKCGAIRGRNPENKKKIEIPEDVETPFMLTEVRTEIGKLNRKEERLKSGKDTTPRNKDSKKYIPNKSKKANCVMTGQGEMLSQVFVKNEQQLELRKDEKTNCLTSVQKDNVICYTDNYIQYDLSGKGHGSQDSRIFLKDKKSNCLNVSHSSIPKLKESENKKEIFYRKLTPIECERLQTVPDNYTNHVSNSQRYKMLGNDWTVKVISHILKSI